MSNTITLTARQLYNILALHNVAPSDDYTAAAGQDYGYVSAWDIDEGYLIKYGNNGETNYGFADDADDLAAWLEYDVSSPYDIVQMANVRGSDAVSEASETDEGPYYVLVTRHWYGPAETSDLIANDDRLQTPREFATWQEATDWIDTTMEDTYTLSYNESGGPSYKIVTA